jgi:riboflavin transporter
MASERTFIGANTAVAGRFLVIAAIASFLPFFIHLQWVTGPIVNALLIISVYLLGLRAALVLCAIPSLMALAGGLLPAVLLPAVPMIIFGNAVLVLAVDRSRTMADGIRGYWFGVGAGALGKYFLLLISVPVLAKYFLAGPVAQKLALMFSWPQLATAVAGGVIAWGVLRFLKRL